MWASSGLGLDHLPAERPAVEAFTDRVPLAFANRTHELVRRAAAGQALTTPSVTSLLSRSTAADEQGGTLGLGASSAAAARAVGPIAAGWAFDHSPALPYLFGAVLLGLAALLLGSLAAGEDAPVASAEAKAAQA